MGYWRRAKSWGILTLTTPHSPRGLAARAPKHGKQKKKKFATELTFNETGFYGLSHAIISLMLGLYKISHVVNYNDNHMECGWNFSRGHA